MLTINAARCPQNHKCPAIAVCPKAAITQTDIYALPVIDKGKCIACGECVKFCPKGAIELAEARG